MDPSKSEEIEIEFSFDFILTFCWKGFDWLDYVSGGRSFYTFFPMC